MKGKLFMTLFGFYCFSCFPSTLIYLFPEMMMMMVVVAVLFVSHAAPLPRRALQVMANFRELLTMVGM